MLIHQVVYTVCSRQRKRRTIQQQSGPVHEEESIYSTAGCLLVRLSAVAGGPRNQSKILTGDKKKRYTKPKMSLGMVAPNP